MHIIRGKYTKKNIKLYVYIYKNMYTCTDEGIASFQLIVYKCTFLCILLFVIVYNVYFCVLCIIPGKDTRKRFKIENNKTNMHVTDQGIEHSKINTICNYYKWGYTFNNICSMFVCLFVGV